MISSPNGAKACSPGCEPRGKLLPFLSFPITTYLRIRVHAFTHYRINISFLDT